MMSGMDVSTGEHASSGMEPDLAPELDEFLLARIAEDKRFAVDAAAAGGRDDWTVGDEIESVVNVDDSVCVSERDTIDSEEVGGAVDAISEVLARIVESRFVDDRIVVVASSLLEVDESKS